MANVLGIPVDIMKSEEGPGLGGAMLAAVACGEYTSVEDAASHIVKIVDTVEPDPDLVKKYDEKYRKFAENLPGTERYLFRDHLKLKSDRPAIAETQRLVCFSIGASIDCILQNLKMSHQK